MTDTDRLTSTLRDAEAALCGLEAVDVFQSDDRRLVRLSAELDRVRQMIRHELFVRERDARDAFNTDPTDGNWIEHHQARTWKREQMRQAAA
jgi:ferredoxin